MLRSVVRAGDDERGAVLIITALLVPALVVCGALAFGVTTLWTGRQDVQRAADLGALASAANVPTVSTDLPLDGLTLFQSLGAPLDANDWRQRACEVTRRQFADGNSPVAVGFKEDGTEPSCTVRFEWESPLLAALSACAADVAELAGCRDDLEAELRADLPAISSLDASASSALAAVASYVSASGKVIDANLATALRSACASETGVTVLGVSSYVCNATLDDLLKSVDDQSGALVGTVSALLQSLTTTLRQSAAGGLLDGVTGGLGFDPTNVPQVGMDLGGLAPALLTPRVHVDLDGLLMRPSFSPYTFDVATGVTARRVFKSALVLPALGIPGTSAWSSLPPETQAALAGVLGPDAPAMLADADGGWVVDPNVLTASAPDVAQKVLSMYDATESQISTTTNDALCTSLPATIACPVGDTLVDRQHLLGPFMEDLWDVTRPPPAGSAPTIQQILEEHAENGEPLLVVSGLRQITPRRIFGGGVWSTVRSAHVGVNLSGQLSELMFIPALDVVPAAVFREGDTFRLERVMATTGLYKARLVK